MMNGFSLDYVSVGVMTDVLPATPRGPMWPNGMMIAARQTIATDAIGTATLTVNGLIAGTEVHCYLTDDETEIGGTEATAGSTFSMSYPFRAVPTTAFLTIIKPGYRWQRIDAVPLTKAGQTILVFPQVDATYSNPP